MSEGTSSGSDSVVGLADVPRQNVRLFVAAVQEEVGEESGKNVLLWSKGRSGRREADSGWGRREDGMIDLQFEERTSHNNVPPSSPTREEGEFIQRKNEGRTVYQDWHLNYFFSSRHSHTDIRCKH